MRFIYRAPFSVHWSFVCIQFKVVVFTGVGLNGFNRGNALLLCMGGARVLKVGGQSREQKNLTPPLLGQWGDKILLR